MATPLLLYKFNEASSGTAPTTVADSAATPANLTITYGGGAAWTTDAGGAAYTPGTAGVCEIIGVSKFRSAFVGAKQVSFEFQENVVSLTTGTDTTSPLFIFDNLGDLFGVDRQTTNYYVATNTAANGDQETPIATASTGYKVCQAVIDTSLASQRRKFYINGFLAGSDVTNVTQNTTFVASGTLGQETVHAAASNAAASGSFDMGFAAVYASALTGADCLAHALRLFADTDSDPNLGAAQLRAASTNGGTNDASTAISDPTIAPTQTVAASGNNRGLFALITGLAVSTGVTACTFNGVAGTKVTSQTSALASTADAEVWWWNDAALPSAAGTYSASITVDGATGTAAATLHYLEGVSQSAPTNFGLQTGTGTSITAPLASGATAGSVILGVLFDITIADTAADGANQLPISVVNGTSTGNTHRQTTSAKFAPTAGANSMSWSGLTNATGKIAIAIEVPGAAPKSDQVPLDAAVTVTTPRASKASRARLFDAVAPVGALIVAAGLSSIGWGPSTPLPPRAPGPNAPVLQVSQPIGTGTFALAKFPHDASAPAPSPLARPAQHSAAPVGSPLAASSLSAFNWHYVALPAALKAPPATLVVIPAGDAALQLTSVGWLNCEAPPKSSLVGVRAQQPVGAESPLKPFVSASTGWFSADLPLDTPLVAKGVSESAPVGSLLLSSLGWQSFPQALLPRQAAVSARPEPSAPVGTAFAIALPSLGWMGPDARTPVLPAPRGQESQQPTGPLAPFVSPSFGWHERPLAPRQAATAPRVETVSPVGNLLAPALTSLGWLGADFARSGAPVAASRQQESAQPTGPLVPFVSLSSGWLTTDTKAPLVPAPRAQDPQQPVGTLLTPQAFGWNTPPQERPSAIVARKVEASAPVGTPFAIALPSNGWLATDNPRTPLALGKAMPTDPVGNLLVLPPLPNLTWLTTENPRTALTLQRAVVVDPVGAKMALPGALGPYWHVDLPPRAQPASPRVSPVDALGSIAATLTSIGWLSPFETPRSPVASPRVQPSDPLRSLQFGGTPWATVELQPGKSATARVPETSAPVGSLLAPSLSTLGWQAVEGPSPATARPIRPEPTGQHLTALAFGGTPWAGLEPPRSGFSTPKLQEPSAPVGQALGQLSSIAWQHVDGTPPNRLVFPRPSESAPVGLLIPPPVLPSMGFQAAVELPPKWSSKCRPVPSEPVGSSFALAFSVAPARRCSPLFDTTTIGRMSPVFDET